MRRDKAGTITSTAKALGVGVRLFVGLPLEEISGTTFIYQIQNRPRLVPLVVGRSIPATPF